MKAGIKGGMIMYDRGRVAMAEARESLEDLTAEAKAELAEGREAPPATKKKAAGGK
jgi:hypothetical protein